MRYKLKAQSLPDWFDLGKYKTLKTATALEWYTQIVIRRECWDFAHYYDPHLEEQDGPLPTMPVGGAAQELLALMRRDGVVRMKDIRCVCKPDVWGDHILCEFDRLQTDIHPLTVEEFYLLRTAMVEPRRRQFDRLFIAELTPEGQSPYSKHIDLKNSYHDDRYKNSGIGDSVYSHQKEHFQQTGLGTISVNLQLPDSLLIAQFKRYLHHARSIAVLPGRRTARRQTFMQWTSYRVIPYIDLTLWDHQTGNRRTDSAIADALFPELEKYDEETLRKVVRPLARELCNRHTATFRQLKREAANFKDESIA